MVKYRPIASEMAYNIGQLTYYRPYIGLMPKISLHIFVLLIYAFIGLPYLPAAAVLKILIDGVLIIIGVFSLNSAPVKVKQD